MTANARRFEVGVVDSPRLDLRAIGIGILIAFFLSVVIAAILAVVIALTQLHEGQIAGTLYYVGLATVALGAAAASRVAKQRGWLHGALTGVGYVILSLALGLLMFPAEALLSDLIVKLLSGGVAGLIGGMIGVNARV